MMRNKRSSVLQRAQETIHKLIDRWIGRPPSMPTTPSPSAPAAAPVRPAGEPPTPSPPPAGAAPTPAAPLPISPVEVPALLAEVRQVFPNDPAMQVRFLVNAGVHQNDAERLVRGETPYEHAAPQHGRIARSAVRNQDSTTPTLFPAVGVPRQERKGFPKDRRIRNYRRLRETTGCLVVLLVLGGIIAWIVSSNHRQRVRAEEEVTRQRQVALAQQQRLQDTLAALVMRHNALTNWMPTAEPLYTVDLQEAMRPPDGRPLLFLAFVEDIRRNHDTYAFFLYAPSAFSPVPHDFATQLFASFFFSRAIYYRLDGNAEQAARVEPSIPLSLFGLPHSSETTIVARGHLVEILSLE